MPYFYIIQFEIFAKFRFILIFAISRKINIMILGSGLKSMLEYYQIIQWQLSI